MVFWWGLGNPIVIENLWEYFLSHCVGIRVFLWIYTYVCLFVKTELVVGISLRTRVEQNNRNKRKFLANLWVTDCSSPVKDSLCSFFLTVLEKTGFFIKLYCNFRSCILAILSNNPRSLSESFYFLPEFCFSEEVFPSFSNAVITFETVPLATQNNSADFVTLAPAIRAPTIWPILKSNKSAILMNFDKFILMISVKKNPIIFVK